MRIDFILNGRPRAVECAPGRRVIDLLREDFGLTGSKEACSSGECGACSILVNGASRLSCLMLACQLQGRSVTTVEGLSPEPAGMHPLQQAFITSGAVQCGYCSPGMLIAAADLLNRQRRPGRQQIRRALSGNLCRCTGYQKIIDAVETAARDWPEGLAGYGNLLNPALPAGPGVAPGEPEVSDGGESDRPVHILPDVPVVSALQGGSGLPALRVLQPSSLEELQGMRRDCPDAVLMAGGTDVLVWIRAGRITTGTLVLTAGVPELQRLDLDGSDLVIGAGVNLQTILDDPRVREGWPLLASALEQIGSPPIRHMATLAGNICSASPAGDSLPVLYILGAELETAEGQRKSRTPIAEFITGPGQTVLREDECLLSVRIPRPAAGNSSGFVKIGQRKALAIAIASLAYSYRLDEEGRVQQMKMAWGSVGPTVMRFPDIEAGFEGRVLDRELIEEWSPRVAERVRPITDVRGSAEYRRLAAGRLLYKTLPQPAGM